MRTHISLLTGLFLMLSTGQAVAQVEGEGTKSPAKASPYDDASEGSDEKPAAPAGKNDGSEAPAPDPDAEPDEGEGSESVSEPAAPGADAPPPDEVDEAEKAAAEGDPSEVPESEEEAATDAESPEPDEAPELEPESAEGSEVAEDSEPFGGPTLGGDVPAMPLAGYAGGRFYLRDARDRFRLFPQGWMAADFGWSPGNPELPADQGGASLYPHFGVRRLRLGFSGEIIERFAFTMNLELGGRRIGTTSYSGEDTSRFAPTTAFDDRVRAAEVTASYRFRRWLGFTAGQQNVPFSMANRTRDAQTPMMERNVAIRGLVVPESKDVGLTVWGDLFEHQMLRYELGIFSGDGNQQPMADERPDFIGRATVRPLAKLGSSTFFRQTHLGVSARFGERDQDVVHHEAPTMATGLGFVLWQPGYVDSLERVTRVIPSGVQKAIGGELRAPVSLPNGSALELRGEAYYVNYRTREAVAGYEATHTERFGRLKGIGWYAQLSWWALGDPFASGEPGVYRPYRLSPSVEADGPKRGLEVIALAAGIKANYDGAMRSGSTPDANTPAADITIYQVGGAVQYWYSTHFRAALNFSSYLVPNAGDSAVNLATVPVREFYDDKGRRGIGEAAHELSGRIAVSF